MTLQRFKAATHFRQLDVISRKGVRLSARTYMGFEVILYQVDGFYAELFYDKKAGGVFVIRAFSTTLLLDPYLENIDIQSLFRNETI
jgi:hypothetical protein